MPRPIWKGHISFGLVSIPVALYPLFKREYDIHFHLVDSRDLARVRYNRINEETGEEVSWNEVAKAYEYDDGNYVLLKEEDIKKAIPESSQTIAIEQFIDAEELNPIYFDKPYILIPAKNAEKGYVLLREALNKTNTIGITKVIIRTREYLAALMVYENSLILNLLRYAQELRDLKEFQLPSARSLKKFRIQPKETEIAIDLVTAMKSKWQGEKYHDEFRDTLMKQIKQKIKKGKVFTITEKEEEAPEPTGKVIDFMELLKKSVREKKKTSPSFESKPKRKKSSK